MSTDLFQALTLGLLVIVILALLVTVSMLGRIRAALEGRSATRPEPAVEGADDAPRAEVGVEPENYGTSGEHEPVSVFEPVGASSDLAEEPVSAATGDDEEDSERPFERGGRWYFRRAGELLVYEEGTGEWVATPSGEDARPAVASHAETVAASSEPATVELDDAEPAAASAGTRATAETPEAAGVVESLEPSTSFAGQPLASAEEDVATLGDNDAADDRDAVVATGFEEPGGGEVALEEAPEEVAARPSESFWRCASCSAVNGSTATSCRMCFAPKP